VTPGALLLVLLIGLGVSVVVIRVAVRPLLLELRALRVDLASGLALDRARRQSEEAPSP
jgi:hypothetical protein